MRNFEKLAAPITKAANVIQPYLDVVTNKQVIRAIHSPALNSAIKTIESHEQQLSKIKAIIIEK